MAGTRPEPQDHVPIGQVVGAFGIKGTVKVAPLTDFPERFAVGATLYIGGEPFKVRGAHEHKGQFRLDLEGVTSIESAESLRSQYLTVPASDRPVLERDEFLSSDLVGMNVVEHGRSLGTVEEVVRSPAHDLLRVGDALIPAVSRFVRHIDLDERVIQVDLIEGLRPGDQD